MAALIAPVGRHRAHITFRHRRALCAAGHHLHRRTRYRRHGALGSTTAPGLRQHEDGRRWWRQASQGLLPRAPRRFDHHAAAHGLAPHQHVAGHHRHGVGHALVAVHDRPGGHMVGCVVPAVARRRVDTFDIHRRAAVVRPEDFARRQRHPAHRRATRLHRDAPLRAAHPGDQRGRIHRPLHVGTRHPAPAPVPRHPTAVVERREAPGRFVDPGPAPGADPAPAAVAVGRPVVAHVHRQPQGAELGVLFPAAVAVEVFDARHLGRDVAAGRTALVAPVFAGHPFAEAIAGHGHPGLVQFTHFLPAALAVQLDTLARPHHVAATFVHTQFATPGAGQRGVVVAVDAVMARALRQQPGFGGDQLDLGGHIA